MASRGPKTRKTAIVIGSGAGGSMAARVLAKSGHFDSVTVLEKGPNYFRTLASPNFRHVGTFFSNDEIKFGSRTGVQTAHDSLSDADPLLDPRHFIGLDVYGNEVEKFGGVNSMPQIVGGGLNASDMKLRRWRPADFKLKTLIGDIPGANVVDWPISYDHLEPFYTLAEYIVGVQGPDELPAPFAPPRRRPYPMSPGVPQYVGLVLANGAKQLGLNPFPAPTGTTSRPYNGRPACNNCGFDGGFGCPIGAKGTPAVTALRDALLTGKTQLMPQSYVYRLNIDDDQVDSVSFFDAEGDSHEMSADVFVIACSPIESARLCLCSGLDNPNIGCNLMFHFQTLAAGLFFPPNPGLPGRLHPHRGRTATYMFDDFAGPAYVRDYAGFNQPRGGTVELGGGQHLIDEAKLYFSGEINDLISELFPGTTPKDLMRLSPLREHLATMTLHGEDLPQISNKVDLDPHLKDVFGVPSPRITYQNHPYELEASGYYSTIMTQVLLEAGAQTVLFAAPATAQTGGVPATGHILGTLPMGEDPDTSVTDPTGRFHEINNLYVADGSLFPTSGGMNPALTIMALGYRVGCSIINPRQPLAVALAIDPELL